MAALIKSLSRFLGSTSRPAIHLAVFGKHPGWIDHLDDIGLDTPALIIAKRLLYTQGISHNIESGAWEKLDNGAHDPQSETRPGSVSFAAPANRLDEFHHDFLWHLPAPSGGHASLLAGRMWSSVDGKGRGKYPMVACAELIGLSRRFAAQIAFPFLARLQQQCTAISDAHAVHDLIATQREDLRRHLQDPLHPDALTGPRLLAIANHPAMHPSPEAHTGFQRIVYQIARGMSGFRGTTTRSGISARAEQLRLPACDMSAPEALVFWLRFVLTIVDPATPLLLLAPDSHGGAGAAWVDLIAGEPAPAHLFCIKAGTKALPLTSEIPYNVDSHTARIVEEYLATCASLPATASLPPWPPFH